MPESIQHKLDRVRRPRVQITYDVETLGSIVKTELPFVVGIMADLSGNGLTRKVREKPDTLLKDRKYVEIDRDSFDTIMEKVKPMVKLNAGDISDELTFTKLDDFDPKNVLDRIPSLKAKFDSRTRLSNLLAKLDGNPTLQKKLTEAIKSLSPDDKQALQEYINVNLHGQGGNGAAAPFDADALIANLTPAQKRTLKAYIVEQYPNTVTPDVLTLANAVTDAAEKTTLKTEILEQYPYVVKADAATLVAAITDAAQKAELLTYIQKQYPATAGGTDLAAVVTSLNDSQKRELRAYIVKKYPDTVTDEVAALVPLLSDADKDELKGFILSNLDVSSANVKTAGEGISKVELTVLMNSLKAAEKRELTAYIGKTYPPPVVEPDGGAK